VQLFWIVGVDDTRLLYALTFAFTLNFFCEHLSAFDAPDRTIRFGKFTGPGEAVALWWVGRWRGGYGCLCVWAGRWVRTPTPLRGKGVGRVGCG
jgi:hypothetical protein